MRIQWAEEAWRSIKRRLGMRSVRAPEWNPMLSTADFELELRRQRAYVDRSKSLFAFVRFELPQSVPDGGGATEWAYVLEESVRGRVRLSDVAGWCSDGQGTVGVILPATDLDGAACVVKAVSEAFKKRVAKQSDEDSREADLSYEVKMYPDEG